jgi:hypothetical protein
MHWLRTVDFDTELYLKEGEKEADVSTSCPVWLRESVKITAANKCEDCL